MNIASFQELVNYVQNLEDKVKLAVVCAHDEHTLESIVHAKKDGLIEPLLIGKEDAISDILKSMDETC